ncbi:MAG: YdcF family protein [Leptolyngbyaceae bacterium]|nr:YdcF family protein [Leptolyngbyaceae bacterium]
MFLFLSKLLPIFIYPLGLACVLMVVALCTLWKRPRIAALSLILALVVIVSFSSEYVSKGLGRSLEWQHLPPDPMPIADAIVVLGGAIRPELPPRPWIDLKDAGDRPLYAAQLYLAGKAPLIIMSGGRINWKNGGPPESSDMATLAEAMGVPAEAILEDPTSLNTYENAVNVKQILERENLNTILLVTSAIHMPRSLKIFEKLGIEAIAAPTDYRVAQRSPDANETWRAQLVNVLPSVERLDYSTRAIKEYIGLVIYRLRGWL